MITFNPTPQIFRQIGYFCLHGDGYGDPLMFLETMQIYIAHFIQMNKMLPLQQVQNVLYIFIIY
jgi:hypothetical protein